MSVSKLHIILSLVVWLTAGAGWAQSFKVKNFRPLPNDISAYINPVYDLNDEACALLKVVATEEFAFSTPLGIVNRHTEVGEIWLYVPRGTRLLTIKHPVWGVIRDYRFPHPLESRMTYELVIDPPLSVQEQRAMRVRKSASKVSQPEFKKPLFPSSLSVGKKRRHGLPWEYTAVATVAAGKDMLLPGLRVAMLKRHGFYVFRQSNFVGHPPTLAECEADGYLPLEGYMPYYSGHTRTSVYMFSAGAVHRLSARLYCYEGVGYSSYAVFWQTADGAWMQNTAQSRKGWAAEAGAMYGIKHFRLSAGVQYLAGNKWTGLAGMGVSF